MKKISGVSLFLGLIIIGFSAQSSVAKEAPEFKTRESMLHAAERKLGYRRQANNVSTSEQDPLNRVQLILDWITIKEDYEKQVLYKNNTPEQLAKFNKSKREVLDHLRSEVTNFQTVKGLNIDPLYRLLAFRFQELNMHEDTTRAFEKITRRNFEDDLAYGDSLLATHRIPDALAAYTRAEHKEELKSVAAYKEGWAYLQQNDFISALREFNRALDDSPHTTLRLKEEAYHDRIRPYVETFANPIFGETQARELRELARRVQPESDDKQKKLYIAALTALISAFNDKANIARSQEVFQFLARETPDARVVLLNAAPLWMKVYRGQLDHDSLERIIRSLPTKKVTDQDTSPLQAELNNTAVFYETLAKDEETDVKTASTRANQILLVVYEKYFQMYPDDVDADPLRVNYARILLQKGDAISCLDILDKRAKKDPVVEEVASNLNAKCALKELDQLYSKAHTDEFYAKLSKALLVTKIYSRSDLGVTSDQAFEGLTQMLTGAVRKNTKSTVLRSTLGSLINDYPYSKESKIYQDLQLVAAELNFADVVADNSAPEIKSTKFFEIFSKAPPRSEVAQKSLQNSILIANSKESLNHCKSYQETYGPQFKPDSELFNRCVRLAEQNLDLEKEYTFWQFAEKSLNDKAKLRMGLLELALGLSKGRARIMKLNTAASHKALESWDGIYAGSNPEKIKNPKTLKSLEANTNYFLETLRGISFKKIKFLVPAQIKNFETLDAQWVRVYKTEPVPLEMAKALEYRARLSTRMRDWMKALPEPPGLNDQEVAQYRTKIAEVVKPWEEKAKQASKDCSEIAFTLTPDFKSESGACKEATPQATLAEFLTAWEKTRLEKTTVGSDQTENAKNIQLLVDAASQAHDELKSKYFLLQASDLASNNHEKAKVQVALAKTSNKERYWRAALSLDGNLIEPIEWLKGQSEGNPFFTRLYNYEISLINQNVHFKGVAQLESNAAEPATAEPAVPSKKLSKQKN